MSSSRHVSEAPAERSSNFAQTCNLLSRYVKEKGSLKNLNIEIGGKVESLEAIVKPGSSFAASSSTIMNSHRNEKEKSARQISAVGQASGPNSAIAVVEEDASNKNSTSKEKTVAEQKPAQLTIFYSGNVLVFNDCPLDKARQIVSIAKRNRSQMSYGILSNAVPEKPNHSARERLPPRPQCKQSVGNSSNTCKSKPDLTTSIAAASSAQPAVISSSACNENTNSTADEAAASSSKAADKPLSLQSEANSSDLPIARRSSIHRFLEKRKDRASGRMPYQNNQEHPGSSSSSKGDGELDLNL